MVEKYLMRVVEENLSESERAFKLKLSRSLSRCFVDFTVTEW
jgi:hypothetical protein